MQPDIASIAYLIGDPSRAKILTALMCGKALTATELAVEADITPQTASSHLSKLIGKQLIIVRKQGRHKYFQLKDTKIAELIESLLNIAADAQSPNIKTGPSVSRLRKSRICYDHLAGELGVTLYDSLLNNGFIIESSNGTHLTDQGRLHFQELGVNFDFMKKSKRPICKSCLDWSERRSHLSGALGKWVLGDILKKSWAVQDLDSRAIQFTEVGLAKFYKVYKIPT